MNTSGLFDSHAHLLDSRFKDDVTNITEGLRGVVCICQPDEDMDLFRQLLLEENVWGAAGIHPHDARKAESIWHLLESTLSMKKVVAVGEIGLDFYYDNSPRDKQEEVFRMQLELARNMDLPAVVHSRNAAKETFSILDSAGAERVLIHCFSGNPDEMQEAVKKGYYISMGGVVTFPKADTAREVVSEVPFDRLLIETDCPYLAPEPVRGRRNEPSYIKYVAEKIAEIRKVSYERVAERTADNTMKFFRI
ncbi:MAG: TatD family hydrolase [Elusimicrobiota bacterium]